MQPARPGAELEVHLVRAVHPLRAAPQAGAAVHALVSVEARDAALARADRLRRADLEADPARARTAELRAQEAHVVGVAGGCLDLAADEERVLLRDEELPVEGD